jgi:gamma-glutamyltranspeptidase / glutathione hydrolase
MPRENKSAPLAQPALQSSRYPVSHRTKTRRNTLPRITVRPVTTALCATLLLPTSALSAQTADYMSEQPTRAKHAMVATCEHNATDAGLAILKQGGNAVDAAVAVGFALAVVFPRAGNIGGGGFMLIRDHSGKTHFLDYREKAPAAATANMYLDAKGNIVPGLSTRGYLASGVPGTVAGLVYAQKHYGKLTLAQDMAPAIKFATDGYTLAEGEAHDLQNKNLVGYPTSHRIYQRDGDFYKAGETFKQPELADTLKRIAADPDTFYKGAMAQQIATFEKAGGGLITAADLAAYEVKDREPLTSTYRGYGVITSPPSSGGGIALIEILNMLSGYDLSKFGADRSPGQVNVIAEVFRRAYMDRNDYLGDPDFNQLPLKQMANPAFADAWRKTITPGKPTPSKDLVRPAGFLPPPPTVTAPPEGTQTTQFSVVDAEGNAVSNTYTLNGFFGSGVTVDGLGFTMNNEMDDFASKVGVRNGFGLIQGPANSIGPGKRPLSSMTPTILTKNGKLYMILGSPGGSTIITTVANDIISVIDNGLNVQQAADAPRFHHQNQPDILQFEKKFDLDTVHKMIAMGYTTNRDSVADAKTAGVWGDSEIIAIDPKTHELLGGHDTRLDYGKAEGY